MTFTDSKNLGCTLTDFPVLRVRIQEVRVLCHKTGDQIGHFLTVFLQRKMPGIEKVKLKVIKIALVWMCSFLREDVVIPPPHDQCRRLKLTKVSLPLWIQRRVRTIIVEQLQLDVLVAGSIHEILIVKPILRSYGRWISNTIGIFERLSSRAMSIRIIT